MHDVKPQRSAPAPTPAPAPQLLRRRCACGGTPSPDGECAACKAKRLAATSRASESLSEEIDAGPPASSPAPAPGVTPPSPPPPVACAHPINWRHGPGAVDVGESSIRIRISWQSSTGSLADLGNCTVREVVTYDPIPNPPFIWNPPNPTVLTVPGVDGAAQDTHGYSPGLQNGISNPRVSGKAVAHQVYQYQCTGPGCSGTWTDFPGETYTITREVYPQFVRLNPLRYRITKAGGPLFIYSREVEIPEPATPPAPAPPGPAPGPVAPPAPPTGGGGGPADAGAATGPGTSGTTAAGPTFQVCARDLQGRLGLFANHAYIEAPPNRYAIISPLCPANWWENPVTGTVGQKWDNSPDPCGKAPRCVDCVPAPDVTDLASCFRNAFLAYSHPSLYKAAGPNSNTFAGTLARRCCAGMVPKPSVLGNCPGWDDPPAPSRTGATPCPPGPTC